MQRRTGFTLIELLIVISILGLLMVALLPSVIGAGKRGKIFETRARMQFLVEMIKAYERKHASYPPDDFLSRDTSFKVQAKADAVNPGIESAIIFLHQHRLGRDSLADHADWLVNTDGDKNNGLIPGLDRVEKMELADAWGMPLAYFSSQTNGYTRAQRIRGPEGIEATVRARTRPHSAKYVGANKFQIISAGPDGIFGDDENGRCDDLVYPAVAKE